MMLKFAVVVLLFGCVFFSCVQGETVQIPYQRVASRPSNNPYCQAEFAFCPTGNKGIPVFDTDDVVEVWALKAPIWEFKFGSLLGKFHAYHDAIGMKSLKTGKNYTMEWYELDQLGNCTFPHELSSGDNESLVWCNQGAACFSEGIDDKHWVQNGTMDLVAHISGDIVNNYTTWMKMDNDTGAFYETWSVITHWDENPNKRNFIFGSYDCKDFVLRSFDAIGSFGGKFNSSIAPPKYTYIVLHAKSVEVVDFNEHRTDILKFYNNFKKGSMPKMLEEMAWFLTYDLIWDHKFYLYYNEEYYLLKLTWPFLSLRYGEHPLPGQ